MRLLTGAGKPLISKPCADASPGLTQGNAPQCERSQLGNAHEKTSLHRRQIPSKTKGVGRSTWFGLPSTTKQEDLSNWIRWPPTLLASRQSMKFFARVRLHQPARLSSKNGRDHAERARRVRDLFGKKRARNFSRIHKITALKILVSPVQSRPCPLLREETDGPAGCKMVYRVAACTQSAVPLSWIDSSIVLSIPGRWKERFEDLAARDTRIRNPCIA